jgi:hypothetical protein
MYGRLVKSERGFCHKETGQEQKRIVILAIRQNFPSMSLFINSQNVTIITVLKKVKQVRIFATNEHAGMNTNCPFLMLMASSWGFLLSAVFS